MATNYDGAIRIARNPEFQRRIEYALVEEAQMVLVEPAATTNNADRVAYAQSLLKAEIDPARITIAAMSVVVGNTSILDPEAVGNGVTDAQVSNAVKSNWNDLAAIARNT